MCRPLTLRNYGAEDEEANIDIDNKKGEDFTMGLLLICRDSSATMMDVLPPLLRFLSPPHRGLLLQWDDRTSGTKNAAVSTITVGKVGIITHAVGSNSAMTNAMDVVAWQQRP